jgi:hypothetical protein
MMVGGKTPGHKTYELRKAEAIETRTWVARAPTPASVVY